MERTTNTVKNLKGIEIIKTCMDFLTDYMLFYRDRSDVIKKCTGIVKDYKLLYSICKQQTPFCCD